MKKLNAIRNGLVFLAMAISLSVLTAEEPCTQLMWQEGIPCEPQFDPQKEYWYDAGFNCNVLKENPGDCAKGRKLMAKFDKQDEIAPGPRTNFVVTGKRVSCYNWRFCFHAFGGACLESDIKVEQQDEYKQEKCETDTDMQTSTPGGD